MNQEHFLTELKIHLKHLPPRQRDYILQIYLEKFNSLIASGLNEAEASQTIGDPKEIAHAILNEMGIQPEPATPTHNDWQEITPPATETSTHPYYQDYPEPRKRPSFFIRFCQVLGILALNFLLMIWVIVSAVMLLFSFWLTVILLLIAPLIGLVVVLTASGAYAFFQLYAAIAFGGLGLIGLALLLPLSRYSFRLIKTYTKWSFSVLGGRST